MLMAGCVLAIASMATAAMNTVLTFSTVGPDKYADGNRVEEGECYALVWTDDVEGFAMAEDGTATGGKVVLVAPVAEDGRCPLVKLNLEASVASEYANGVWGVYLLDTRNSPEGERVISAVKLIPGATVEVASDGYLVRKSMASRVLLGLTSGDMVVNAAELASAVAAGGTVTLGSNITLTDELTVDKAVALDLGEYTITAATGKDAIQVVAGGDLTVNATTGGIAASAGHFAIYTDYEKSVGEKAVTINSGTFGTVQFNKYPIQTTAAQSGEAVTPTTVVVTGGTFEGGFKVYHCPVTIAGGTFEQGLDTSVGSITVYSNSRTPISITGGTFKTEPINVGGRVMVAPGYYEGGWFKIGDTAVCEAKRNGKYYRFATEAFATIGADTKIEILNGDAVSSIQVTLGEGQSVTVPAEFTAVTAVGGLTLETAVDTAAGTITYSARPDGKVAKIDGTYYATLDEAIGAATDGATITLVANATLGVATLDKKVTLALAGYQVAVTTETLNLTAGKLTVTGMGLVSSIPAVTGKSNLVIAGGTWMTDPSKYVPEIVTALPNEQPDAGWRKDRYYVFKDKAFGGVANWVAAPGYWTVVPLPKAYVTPMDPKPVVGADELDCAYTFESFSSENGDEAIAAAFLADGFSAFSNPVQLARAIELLMEKLPFIDWTADFVVSLDRAAAKGDVSLSGYYPDWGVWMTYTSPEDITAGKKIRLLTDIGKATPGDWTYENICRHVRTFNCGADMLSDSLAGTTMTVQLRLYKPDTDEGLGSPSIVICEYKYTFGGKAAKIVRATGTETYDSVVTAIDAAQSGETVVLLNDFAGDIDLGECEKAFTIDVNGFGCAANVTAVNEGWAIKELSNRNLSYYLIPVPTTTGTTKTVVEVVTDSGEKVELAPVTISEESTLGQEIAVATQDNQATVEEVLAWTDDNGLQKWQNYVLGQDPTAAVKVDSTQSETVTEMPVTNTLTEKVNVPTDSGFTVKYEIDEVSVEGAVVNEGEKKETAETLTVDLEGATEGATTTTTYFKMSAVIKSEETGAETKVPSENTIGVMAVKQAPATTIVAVPWSSLSDDGDISVDNLVRTANLTPGDTMTAYDAESKTYKMWELNEQKEWEVTETITAGGSSTSEDPIGSKVARGSGVWLTRQNPEEPIYLVGQVDNASEVETPLVTPEEGEKTWNIVASPSVEPVDVAELLEGKEATDQVMVPTAGAPKNFICIGGVWGYVDKEPVEGDPNGFYPVFRTGDTTIPAGTGFFYLNGDSTDDDKKINW